MAARRPEPERNCLEHAREMLCYLDRMSMPTFKNRFKERHKPLAVASIMILGSDVAAGEGEPFLKLAGDGLAETLRTMHVTRRRTRIPWEGWRKVVDLLGDFAV